MTRAEIDALSAGEARTDQVHTPARGTPQVTSDAPVPTTETDQSG